MSDQAVDGVKSQCMESPDPMNKTLMLRLAAFACFAGSSILFAGCGRSTTGILADAREGGGTPTLFDNPPMGDPLAPSQAKLNARRPARKAAAPRR